MAVLAGVARLAGARHARRRRRAARPAKPTRVRTAVIHLCNGITWSSRRHTEGVTPASY